MANKNLADLSDMELIRDEKKIKFLTLMLAGALLALFLASIFLTSQKGFSALTITPVALLPILIINLGNWNAYKKEIKSRNL